MISNRLFRETSFPNFVHDSSSLAEHLLTTNESWTFRLFFLESDRWLDSPLPKLVARNDEIVKLARGHDGLARESWSQTVLRRDIRGSPLFERFYGQGNRIIVPLAALSPVEKLPPRGLLPAKLGVGGKISRRLKTAKKPHQARRSWKR